MRFGNYGRPLELFAEGGDGEGGGAIQPLSFDSYTAGILKELNELKAEKAAAGATKAKSSAEKIAALEAQLAELLKKSDKDGDGKGKEKKRKKKKIEKKKAKKKEEGDEDDDDDDDDEEPTPFVPHWRRDRYPKKEED